MSLYNIHTEVQEDSFCYSLTILFKWIFGPHASYCVCVCVHVCISYIARLQNICSSFSFLICTHVLKAAEGCNCLKQILPRPNNSWLPAKCLAESKQPQEMIILKYHPCRFSDLKEIMVEMGNRRELKVIYLSSSKSIWLWDHVKSNIIGFLNHQAPETITYQDSSMLSASNFKNISNLFLSQTSQWWLQTHLRKASCIPRANLCWCMA